MRKVSQAYRKAIQQHRERGYRDGVYARITIGSYVFNSDDILKLTHKRTAHPLSLNLPVASLSFTLKNENHTFDPDSGNAIVGYLTEDREVKLEYGIDITGQKNIEWFVGGYFYLQSWDAKGVEASFRTIDIFNRLTKSTYKKGIFDGSVRYTKDLAEAVLIDAGVSNYRLVGEHLTTTSGTALPLPYASHAECLQLLANISLSTLDTDPDGAIVMRHREEIEPEEWEITLYPSGAPPVLPGSNPASLALGTPKYNYATWEQNFFALDGAMRLYPRAAPHLDTGVDFDVFPDASGGYLYNGARVGVRVDLLQVRTFGVVEVELPEYARINSVRITSFGANGAVVTDGNYPVTGVYASAMENFEDVRQLLVTPTSSSEYQRARIRNVRIDNAVWPFLTYDDVIGTLNKKRHPLCGEVRVHHRRVAYMRTQKVELLRRTVPPGELVEIQHGEIFYNMNFTSEAQGVIFEVEEHYAYTSFIRISGVTADTEVILMGGRIMDIVDRNAISTVHGSGAPLFHENPISSQSNLSGRIAAWMGDYYKNLAEFDAPTLGYPECDANDQMRFEGKRAVILDNTITLDQGAMRGTIKARGE